MKKLLVLIFFAIVANVISSCSKNISGLSSAQINGTWKLTRITGGIAGIDSIPTDDITIAFDLAGKYSTTFNYAITASGTYTLSKAGEPNYYYSDDLVNLTSNNQTTTYGIVINSDSFVISQGCCDQFAYSYIRQK